ncbi:MAG: tyrosine-type recombinase/integrase [archaeon]
MPLLDYEGRHKQIVEKVKENSEVSEANKQLFEDYHRYLLLQDYSPAHLQKLLSHLKLIVEYVEFDLRDAEKEQIEKIVAWVNSRDIAEATKRQYKIVLKVVYKWLNDGEYPEKVKWINTTEKKRNGKIPEKMLTESDVKELIKHASNPRDRALISLLWETGARIGELIDLTIGDFEDRERGLKIVISGKTGPRRLPLVSSVPDIRNWLNSHPRKNENDAPVWVNIGTRNNGEKAEYRALLKALNKTADKAGIDKPVNPHQFRHSRATFLANRFTESQMCEWFGWVQGSDQPARYVHLSGRDIDEAYDKIHGLKQEEEKEDKAELSPIECPRCEEQNSPDAKFCQRCGQALSIEAAQEIEKKEEKVSDEFVTKLKDSSEAIEKLNKAFELVDLIDKNDELVEVLEEKIS